MSSVDTLMAGCIFNLFVGWLSSLVTSVCLKDIVHIILGHEPLTASVVCDNDGVSKGFGFVMVLTKANKDKLIAHGKFNLQVHLCLSRASIFFFGKKECKLDPFGV